MSETPESSSPKSESEYRALFETPGERVITLAHLFDAVEDAGLRKELFRTLDSQSSPIEVLIEGSAVPRNLEIIQSFLGVRKNHITLIDKSDTSVRQHSEHIEQNGLSGVDTVQADMNAVPVQDGRIHMLINDCAINFNTDDEGNRTTVQEMQRVLAEGGVALVTVVVPHVYDLEHGGDHEHLPYDFVTRPQTYSSFETLQDGRIRILEGTERLSWSVPYYRQLFESAGLEVVAEFDQDTGRTFFPEESGISYRRFMLRKIKLDADTKNG